MSIFDKQVILFTGKSKLIYDGYLSILRSSQIKYKAYMTDDLLRGGCCGLNSGNGLRQASYTYTISVKAKEADAARELVSTFKS